MNIRSRQTSRTIEESASGSRRNDFSKSDNDYTVNDRSRSSTGRRALFSASMFSQIPSLMIGMLVGAFIVLLLTGQSPTDVLSKASQRLRATTSSCQIYLGQYRGSSYRNSNTVGQPKCLLESKFIRIQQHAVKLGNDDENHIIPDWIFVDYYDRINVLVEAADQKNQFYVFEQTKYALEDRQSSAIVGGIIEPGEGAEEAARREVSEELGVVCKQFDFLGRYRTDVNRGVGWTNTFVARSCKKGKLAPSEDISEEVGAPDTERQDLVVVSTDELRKRLVEGNFIEIQWSATVALALMHISS